jgi:uncharacterized protein (TIGR00297 family)
MVFAGIVIFIARRQRALSPSGAAAAFVVGTICAAAGWGWAILLATFFVSASVLSLNGRALKAERTRGMIEKGDERDAAQVIANGGMFATLAIVSLFYPSLLWLAAGAGAIAASTADTWATEIGTLARHSPRLITTREPVPAGTSGAVTWRGTFAGIAGAALIAVVALMSGWGSRAALAAIAGGLVGSLVDSVLGATVQRRQWCERCNKATERLVHTCGTITQPRGGIGWVGNDMINALGSFAGAVAGSFLLR